MQKMYICCIYKSLNGSSSQKSLLPCSNMFAVPLIVPQDVTVARVLSCALYRLRRSLNGIHQKARARGYTPGTGGYYACRKGFHRLQISSSETAALSVYRGNLVYSTTVVFVSVFQFMCCLYTNSSSFSPLRSIFLNLLSPDVKMHILLTVLYTFLMEFV